MDNSFKINKGLNLVGQTAEPAGANGDAYYNATLNKFRKYENGAWSDFASGDGALNYVKNPDAEADTSDTGDSGANVTITRATTTPLRGSGSFEITFANGSTTSDYAEWDLDIIDIPDEGKDLFISLDYATDTGITSADFELFLYDVTATTEIALTDNALAATGNFTTGNSYAGKVTINTSNTDYKLRVKPVALFGTERKIRFDNISINTEILIPGLLPKDRVVFTGTESVATATDVTFDPLTSVEDNVGGLNGASRYTFQHDGEFLITGYAKFNSASSAWRSINYQINGGAAVRPLSFDGSAATASSHAFSDTVTVVKGDYIEFYARHTVGANETIDIFVTIEEVTQRSGMVSTTENLFKNVDVRGEGNGGTSITANVTDIDFTEVSDELGLWDGSQLTAREDGLVQIEGCTNWTTNVSPLMSAYIDGTLDKVVGFDAGTTSQVHTFSAVIYLLAGEVLSFRSSAAGTLLSDVNRHWISINSVKDTSAFAVSGETELVESIGSVASYVITTGQYGDLTSITLTPGEWDLESQILYKSNGATTTTNIYIGMSTTSGNSAVGMTIGDNLSIGVMDNITGSWVPMHSFQKGIVVTDTTIYYLKARADGSITNLQDAYKISARRVK